VDVDVLSVVVDVDGSVVDVVDSVVVAESEHLE